MEIHLVRSEQMREDTLKLIRSIKAKSDKKSKQTMQDNFRPMCRPD